MYISCAVPKVRAGLPPPVRLDIYTYKKIFLGAPSAAPKNAACGLVPGGLVLRSTKGTCRTARFFSIRGGRKKNFFICPPTKKF